MFKNKEEELLKEIENYVGKLEKVRGIRNDLEDVQKESEIVDYTYSSPKWLIPFGKDALFYETDNDSAVAGIKFVESVDTKYSFVMVPSMDDIGMGYRHYVGMSVSAEVEKPQDAIYIPGCTCMVFHFIKHWDKHLHAEIEAQVFSVLRKKGFSLDKPVWGYEVMHLQHENGKHDIDFKVYVPTDSIKIEV